MTDKNVPQDQFDHFVKNGPYRQVAKPQPQLQQPGAQRWVLNPNYVTKDSKERVLFQHVERWVSCLPTKPYRPQFGNIFVFPWEDGNPKDNPTGARRPS